MEYGIIILRNRSPSTMLLQSSNQTFSLTNQNYEQNCDQPSIQLKERKKEKNNN